MHQYRHGKLPPSFSGIFTETTMSNEMQSRHNDYNYLNKPAVKGRLEQFPLKQIIFKWNRLDIDLKSTGNIEDFQRMLNSKILACYKIETECPDSCNNV